MNDELNRLKQIYKKYDQESKYREFYSVSKGAQYNYKQRSSKIKQILSRKGILQKLLTSKILEIGCAGGWVLEEFHQFGAKAKRLYGIDIRKNSLRRGKDKYPFFHYTQADATYLPFQKHSFDIGITYTVFSSLFDTQMKRNIGKELLRVIKPEGIILWYDVRYPNPFNPHTIHENKVAIRSYFPDCSIEWFSMTLIPHIARLFAPISWRLCAILEQVSFMRSHYFAINRKNEK